MTPALNNSTRRQVGLFLDSLVCRGRAQPALPRLLQSKSDIGKFEVSAVAGRSAGAILPCAFAARTFQAVLRCYPQVRQFLFWSPYFSRHEFTRWFIADSEPASVYRKLAGEKRVLRFVVAGAT